MTTLTGAAERLRKLIEDHTAGTTALYLVARDRSVQQLYAWLPQTSTWYPVPEGAVMAATVGKLTAANAIILTPVDRVDMPPALANAIRRHEDKDWRSLANVQQIHQPKRQMPYRSFPCGPCPIRADNKDNPEAKFPAHRWEALSATVPDPQTGMPPLPGTILFGCHKGKPGSDEDDPQPEDDLACAGWLARFGYQHLTVRLALNEGRLPLSALEPGPNWPPLHESWDDVVRYQTSDTDTCPLTGKD